MKEARSTREEEGGEKKLGPWIRPSVAVRSRVL